jgi:hypothetical protein
MNYGVHADNCKYVRLTKEGTKWMQTWWLGN